MPAAIAGGLVLGDRGQFGHDVLPIPVTISFSVAETWADVCSPWLAWRTESLMSSSVLLAASLERMAAVA